MTRRLFAVAVVSIFLSGIVLKVHAAPRSLFQGTDLAGWEGNTNLWRVEDGAITGGSLTEKVAHNDFLATTESFDHFELRLMIRIEGTNGFINSGIQIRSQRAAKGHEMVGYQVDAGEGWWGKLYDESRRNRVIGEAADLKAVNAAVRKGDWNEFVIRAEGSRIRSWINGVAALDYRETDPAIPRSGRIGLQIHGGGMALVRVRNVTIEPLPAPSEFVGASEPMKPAAPSPLSPSEEKATFNLAPGFEIELVAAEAEGIGKFVAVAWDQKGRLWTMTALEYPVDSNENAKQADALYASHAKDRVLVFDRPFGPGPQTPRVFAEGLAIPLGLLPHRDGVLVQHGHDLAFLRDADGDGRSDQREVVLSGFGVQDSHLFPHQFTRAPGNWMWLAQGAFNSGKVKTRGGDEIPFDRTRMAKFRADGSEFDITSQGPCNIWGLVLTDEGEAWIQEANDFGYPVMPFHEYANYPGCSDGLWKSYAPEFPGSTPHFKMGGTGLSGLALSDRTLWPTEYADVMYVANPITRKVQAIRIHRDGPYFRYEQLGDLVVSGDEWFRPVALSMGPDGCLYIVDWYNKIISHNEVPRNHPERDKIRGRIWRVKHRDQQPLAVPDFTALAPDALVARMGGPSLAQTHLAWQAVVDRGLVDLAPVLSARALDTKLPPGARLPALWALEGLQATDLALLKALMQDTNRNVRREAVRACNELAQATPDEIVNAVTPLRDDADPEVRAEVLRTAGRRAAVAPTAISLLVQAGRQSLTQPLAPSTRTAKPIPVREAYDRAFERYLVRLFLERVPNELAVFLATPEAMAMPVENRLWAALALAPEVGAVQVADLLPRLNRPPNREEVLRLVNRAGDPAAGATLHAALANPVARGPVLDAMIEAKTRIDPVKAARLVTDTARELLRGDEAAVEKGLQLASGFDLRALEPDILSLLSGNPSPKRASSALKALAELGGGQPATILQLARESEDATVRDEAVAALASLKGAAGAPLLLGAWTNFTATQRRTAVDRLSRLKPGAQAIAAGLRKATISRDDLDAGAIERMQMHLKGDPGLTTLMRELGEFFRPTLTFDGQEEAWVDAGLKLDGPFTLETWVRLDPGIGAPDGLLGAPGQLDVNFHDSKLRVYLFPPLGDVVIARKPVVPGLWTHVAVVRDAEGCYHLYQNGELDSSSTAKPFRSFTGLRIAWTAAAGGLGGALAEYRIWNRVRTAQEIRAHFDRSLSAMDRPADLLFRATGDADWGPRKKGVRIAFDSDQPPVQSEEKALELDRKFARYRALAAEPGDRLKGQQMAALCLACHTIRGQGGNIGPNLSSVGAMGVESILRNLLTPNAAMEPGYRIFRAEMRDGEIREGFLVSEDKETVVLRRPGAEDSRIPQSAIARTTMLRRSLMPEGLLDALPDETVRDLLAYLQSLK